MALEPTAARRAESRHGANRQRQMTKTKVGLVFDDGFRKSSVATAAMFERFGLAGVFAVLAEPAGFALKFDVGRFELWNELQARGHVVQPHGYTHANLRDLPHEQAVDLVD